MASIKEPHGEREQTYSWVRGWRTGRCIGGRGWHVGGVLDLFQVGSGGAGTAAHLSVGMMCIVAALVLGVGRLRVGVVMGGGSPGRFGRHGGHGNWNENEKLSS